MASYHSVQLGDGRVERDLVWCYREPYDEVARIAGLVCFFNERVDLKLDGELQERPESPWSHGVKDDAANAPPAVTRGCSELAPRAARVQDVPQAFRLAVRLRAEPALGEADRHVPRLERVGVTIAVVLE